MMFENMSVGISTSSISKRLVSNQALTKVSLEFSAGMIHGIIGPDGAGKTTLIRHLIGLLKADSGRITYTLRGKDTQFSVIKPFISYMPGQASLYADLTIEEHLDFFKALYTIPEEEYRERRAKLLQITRLSSFTDRAVGKLSGGMYKKVALMCALLSSPAVLFLDEPTNGVDPISRREFWELLYTLSAQSFQKILVIIATAYMDEAERCERVHLLDNGQVLASGPPKIILEQAQVPNFDSFFIKHAHLEI